MVGAADALRVTVADCDGDTLAVALADAPCDEVCDWDAEDDPLCDAEALVVPLRVLLCERERVTVREWDPDCVIVREPGLEGVLEVDGDSVVD